MGPVAEMLKVQGRRLGPRDVEAIRELIAAHPHWHRRRISEVLAQQWDWRNAAGQLKDMAARSLLLKLAERGLVKLPPRRRAPVNRMGARPRPPVPWDQAPVHCPLKQLQPLRVQEVSREREPRRLLEAALREFHYLGHAGTVGQNLQYCLRDRLQRPLGFMLFGAAAWKCQDRDEFIGWSGEQRERNLGRIANNTRLLLLPWVRVQALGSWFLGRVSRRIREDWRQKYGHSVALLETFVEEGRFRGTVYRAANWRKVGLTKGRSRQDPEHQGRAPLKAIYLYPLASDFREELGA
jgi:hypothetical protein